LLFNAMKHSGATESYVTLLRTKDHHLKLVIRDEGKGFDPDMLEQRRDDESAFGLFSIQQRMAHIGGNMEISTAPGKGTSITLTAPEDKTRAITKRADKASGGIDVRFHSMKTVRRVLVVDDHRIVREGLIGLLQSEPDIEIAGQAGNGPQAVELAQKLKPDVIIMDVSLGEMSGIEASKRIIAGMPNTKIIGLSMYTDPNMASAMHKAGAVAYLTKGCPPEDLIAAIRNAHAV
jgi:CheY-like chemotaxis protein